jgi:hypothetical protein
MMTIGSRGQRQLEVRARLLLVEGESTTRAKG